MFRFATFIVIIAFFTGCSTFAPRRTADPVKQLRSAIDRELADSIFIPSLAAVKVVSLESGQTLYERNTKLVFRPASNTKLFTSAAALAVLGPSYSFRTLVSTDSADGTGICKNIFLKGMGDPDLTSAEIDSMAEQVVRRGITTVLGDIVADATFFDDEYWGAGWMWDDETDPDGASVAALSVNKNCVRVTIWPDSATQSFVQVRTEPATAYVPVLNCAVVSLDTLIPRLTVKRHFIQRSNTISIEGRMRPGERPRTFRVALWQPELYAGTLLKEALERRGVRISGTVRHGIASPGGIFLADNSQPIDSMVINLNKISDNLSAENTLKTISAVAFQGTGTSASGLYIVNRTLSEFGIDTTKHRFVDGSGLSHYNLVSAETITQLLVGMYKRTDIFPIYYESLPIAGKDGTIARRMIGTAAEGNLRAKTGTISGVSALSGYVRTQDGEMLAFSLMMQNYIGSAGRYQAAQDRIGALLAAFSRSNAVAAR